MFCIFLNKKLPALIIFSLTFAFHFSLASVLKENTTYNVQFSFQSSMGVATLVKKGKKLIMKLPIRIVGASLFGRTTSDEIFAQTGVRFPPEYFKSGAKSFDEIPELKKRFLEYASGIEDVFNTSFFKLDIDFIFSGDEYALVKEGIMIAGKRNDGSIINYNVDLDNLDNVEMNPKKLKPVPTDVTLKMALNDTNQNRQLGIVLTPLPDMQYAHPGRWDLMSDPSIMAHELGHSLGISEEGYLYSDYPPNGLMSDEVNLLVLKELAPSVQRKLLRIDLNTMLVGRGYGRAGLLSTVVPKIDLKAAQLEFSPTYVGLTPWPQNIDYFNISGEERKALVTQNVKAWLKKQK